MMSHATTRSLSPAARAILLGLLLVGSALAAFGQIQGTLSNFDARNDTGRTVTNLELDLRLIQPWDVVGHYQGPNSWGLPPIVRDVGGAEVTWADFHNPLMPGMTRHFGLSLAPGTPPPCGVTAHWTRHEKVVEIPVPWQSWRMTSPNQVVDVIRLDSDFAAPVLVRREFLTLSTRIPLVELQWDLATPLPWTPVAGDPVVLAPGSVVELPIQMTPGTAAVLVRYTVAIASNPENVLVRFVNEAEVETMMPPFGIVGLLSNFDAINDTGKPVHDLELDIRNVLPADILEWYSGSQAWGVPPVIQALPGVDPATEVTWVDEWNPLPYGQTKHFGLRLNPFTPEPLVRAYWTRVVKVAQIPVPWQWWEPQPAGVMRDVIQLSDMFPEPVIIEREWATLTTPVPLDLLVWDNPTIPWQPDPAGPVEISPGVQSFFDIFTDASTRAVAVRYTVRPLAGSGTTATRFVNEAVYEPTAAAPGQIVGSLSNFDATNLTGGPVTNLELDLRNVHPHQIVDWYRGPLAWGLHPILFAPVIAALPQTEVTWADFRSPLATGEIRHFGIDLAAGAPISCGVQAYWTRHEKIADIPVPWQSWELAPGGVLDVVRLSQDFPQPVLIRRDWAVTPFRLQLDELVWDNPAIPWMPYDPMPVTLGPGGTALLPIEAYPGSMAAFVRYTVALASNPGVVVTRFVNEAWINTMPPFAIVGSLSNFDVVNTTGKPVHDLELDLAQINPSEIVGWYGGPLAWGIPPVIVPLGATLGTEVTWVDDRMPMEPGEMRHFGLTIAPGAPEPLVRASWTREVKVAQIPVPWQFWLVPPGNIVRDVVQLSDTFDRPVTIRRQFAVVMDPVPLDELNWDLAAPWQADPAGPIALRPGFQAPLDIPVDWTRWGAVLVRYEVSEGTATSVRFVNEAILGPGIVSGLRFDGPADIAWSAAPLQSAVYDIVRGKIGSLRVLGGVADAACLPGGDNLLLPEHTDPTTPVIGEGFYYLVRSELAGEVHGTYDSTTDPVTREGRDGEIGPADCP